MARRMYAPKMEHAFYRCGRHCLPDEWCYRSSIYFAIALCASSRTQNLLAHKMQMDATAFIIGVIRRQYAAKKLKGLNFDVVWRLWLRRKTEFGPRSRLVFRLHASKRRYTYIPRSHNQRKHPDTSFERSSIYSVAIFRSPIHSYINCFVYCQRAKFIHLQFPSNRSSATPRPPVATVSVLNCNFGANSK